MPLENTIWCARVELCNTSIQHAKLKTPKRKLYLNHESAAALLDLTFIRCLQMVLFLLELRNYVKSFCWINCCPI